MIIENVPFNTIDDTQSLVAATIMDVAKAVISTMGPNGKLALIEMGTSVKATKDGVTVAKALKFDDPRKEVVSRLIIEPAVKTDTECGDGTTTTVFLTNLFYELLAEHTSYLERKFIETLVGKLIAELEAMAVAVTLESELLYPLALTSSNNDEKLAKAVIEIYQGGNGRFPYVELKEGTSAEDKVFDTEEMVIRMTMANPAFSAHGNGMDTLLTRTMPIVIDGNLSGGSQEETIRLIAELSKIQVTAEATPNDPLNILIIARNVDHSFNSILVAVNAISRDPAHRSYDQFRGKRFLAAHTNMGGSIGTLLMQDIAVVLGAKLYNSLDQLFDSKDPSFETSEKILLGSQRSTIKLSAAGQARAATRIKELQNEVDKYPLGERFSPKAKFTEKRIRDLSGALVTVFVGGETYSEIKERIDRFEDVIKAVRSALENGVLPGVGTALITAFATVQQAFKADQMELPEMSKDEWVILQKLEDLVEAQYVYLMHDVIDRKVGTKEGSMMNQAVEAIQDSLYTQLQRQDGISRNFAEGSSRPLLCVNLSTGKVGEPEALGIYDTAYASITALRGGFQTAKILASASSLLLGNKLGGVKI